MFAVIQVPFTTPKFRICGDGWGWHFYIWTRAFFF